MIAPMLIFLLCGNNSDVNAPKLDNPALNQMQLLLLKDKAREEFKQMKEKQNQKPMFYIFD